MATRKKTKKKKVERPRSHAKTTPLMRSNDDYTGRMKLRPISQTESVHKNIHVTEDEPQPEPEGESWTFLFPFSLIPLV